MTEELKSYGLYRTIGASQALGGAPQQPMNTDDIRNALFDLANVIRMKNLDIEVINQPPGIHIPQPVINIAPPNVTIEHPKIVMPNPLEPIVIVRGASSKSVYFSAAIIATAIVCDLVARILHFG